MSNLNLTSAVLDFPQLIIIRGPSGFGKSTFAEKIQEKLGSDKCDIHEADNFFYEDGVYRFDPNLLGKAHQYCRDSVKESLSKGKTVVVSNTSTRLKEFSDYIKMTELFEATVEVVRMKTRYKNTHGVPETKVDQMISRMEAYPGEMTSEEFEVKYL